MKKENQNYNKLVSDNMEKKENNLLEHAIINQLEFDFNLQDYTALSELIQRLIFLEPARKLLIAYLSDTEKEQWLEKKTNTRY